MADNLPATDFLIIGSGLAGLFAALTAARHGSVALVTKSDFQTSNSSWAQGGIAAAIGPDDSPELHLQDTLEAGRGLSSVAAVEILVRNAATCVERLQSLGVAFDSDETGIHLGREGGHSRRRTVHAGGSATGESMVRALAARVRETPRIRIVDGVTTTELLMAGPRCVGAAGILADGGASVFPAAATVLATGGLAGLFARSTNPPTTTGDGIALAYRAGAELVDMEFIQFHPTALCIPGRRSFLITEALRGEGATLLNTAGERFMPAYHPMAELGPRDVVASAIRAEMQRAGSDHVLLDLRHLGLDLLRRRFPNIYDGCLAEGIDVSREPVPVAPAAHYTMGGVRTDADARTSVEGLWACGEVACTGVHGANRLAGNSLLECLVFSQRAIEAAARTAVRPAKASLPRDAQPVPAANPAEFSALSQVLTANVGLLRNEAGLKRAERCLDEMSRASEYQSAAGSSRLLLAQIITKAALLRTESRGAHRREDFPREDPGWLQHIVFQKDREAQFAGV
jgi:L-aspartate oxidase